MMGYTVKGILRELRARKFNVRQIPHKMHIIHVYFGPLGDVFLIYSRKQNRGELKPVFIIQGTGISQQEVDSESSNLLDATIKALTECKKTIAGIVHDDPMCNNEQHP